jgi:hypothetical protein
MGYIGQQQEYIVKESIGYDGDYVTKDGVQ